MDTPLHRRVGRLLPPAGLLAAIVAIGVPVSCKDRTPPAAQPAPVPAPVPAPASLPTSAPGENAALEKLRQLEQQGLVAIAERQHGPLLRAAEALDQLVFERPENARRRDALAGEFRSQAETIRDALHRFLFVELDTMRGTKRNALLAVADRGDSDAIERSAGALAEHAFDTGRRYLRNTPTLRARSTDPATGLSVRYAGPFKSDWKKRFNEAFNARMRALALATRPAE